MKKVLIITYYWPPSGGAGVQRWLKFSKYFPDHKWKPVIYTPENPEYPAVDESLLEEIHAQTEVIKSPIWEPYSAYKKFTSRGKEAKIATGFTSEKKGVSRAEKVARFIRGNFFIPDARKYWIKPSIQFLNEYLKENPVDAIISTGPPHSMHLIAAGLKKKFSIPWLADFRDPWTNIDFIEELKLTQNSKRKHAQLELKVLQQADAVITIGNDMKREFSSSVELEKIHVIPNGFDAADFKQAEPQLDQKFSLAHIGSFSPARNVPAFWEALQELVTEIPDFKNHLEIKIVGQVDHSVKAQLKEKKLMDFCSFTPYLPHNEVVKYTSSSQMLLLFVNKTKNAKGIITGKVFEYLISGRPIFSIGPVDGDLAQLMTQVNALPTIGYEDKTDMKHSLRTSYEAYLMGKLRSQYKDVHQFDRKALTEQFVKLMNVLIKQ